MTLRSKRRASVVVGSAAVALLALAACGGSSGGGSSAGASMPAGCESFASYGSHPGTKVKIFTSILPPEQQRYEASWKQFETCTGIDIVYEGSDQFEAQLPTRIAGGNAPDIAFIPQPGLLQKLVQQGGPVEPNQATSDNVDKYWPASWKAYGTVDGTFYAAPLSSNMKSFVWYSPKVFKDKGYTVPTTWDELMQLSDKMKSDGITPWCGGIESGGATGWPATDWVEEVVLGSQGGDVYDKWVSHEIKFDSPEINAAMDVVNGWMRNSNYVNGGFGDVKTIATTAFQDAGKPILSGKCGMLQQASFYGAQWASFKKDVKVTADGDAFAFYLPAQNTSVSTPVEGGGEFVTAFADRPEVQQVQAYLSSAEWHTEKVKQGGGWVSGNSGVDIGAYGDQPIAVLSAKYLTDPNATLRFDASDLMPAAVGSGSFWTQMTAWFGENKDTKAVLQAIDASWPS